MPKTTRLIVFLIFALPMSLAALCYVAWRNNDVVGTFCGALAGAVILPSMGFVTSGLISVLELRTSRRVARGVSIITEFASSLLLAVGASAILESSVGSFSWAAFIVGAGVTRVFLWDVLEVIPQSRARQ